MLILFALTLQDNLLNGFQIIYTCVKMYIRIKETFSEVHNVSSVPQSSVLASLFFILYINICNVVKYSKMLMYAGDLTLSRVVNNAHDASLLQCDSQAIRDWAKSWLLYFPYILRY